MFLSLLLLLPATVMSHSVVDYLDPSCGVFNLKDRAYLGRVIGGTNAPKMWPWMAHIFIHHFPESTNTNNGDEQQEEPAQWKDSSHCGGSVIDKYNVLTAAHCLHPIQRLSSFEVLIGEYRDKSPEKVQDGFVNDPEPKPIIKSFQLGPENAKYHPKYDQPTHRNDIALIHLPSPLSFVGDRRSKPICLPMNANDSAIDFETIVDIDDCFVTGWGALCEEGPDPEVLQQGRMMIADETRCKSKEPRFDKITQLCAFGNKTLNEKQGGGPQPCAGDSGGPLQCRVRGMTDKWVLMGVVNHGKRYCGAPKYPDYFARVQGHLEWIKNNMKVKKNEEPISEDGVPRWQGGRRISSKRAKEHLRNALEKERQQEAEERERERKEELEKENMKKKGDEKSTEKPKRHVHDMMIEPSEEEEQRRWKEIEKERQSRQEFEKRRREREREDEREWEREREKEQEERRRREEKRIEKKTKG